MEGMRLPDQQKRLERVLQLAQLRLIKIDMTGLGLGLCEYTQEKFGRRVAGVNFAGTVVATDRSRMEGRAREKVRVTEAMASQLLQAFEDRAMHCPADLELREDLRKPERLISPSGRVSIAATRDESGHADHFWSLALAIDAGQTTSAAPTILRVVERRSTRPFFRTWKNGVSF
jgi:phage FluMu gp28-like protein